MIKNDISGYVPHARPHNRLHEGKVYFMISSRPTLALSDEEILLYNKIDGVTTVAELEKTHGDVRRCLLRWQDAYIIELIAPIVPPKHPHVVVIEPHMDDAVLSAGGRLLRRRSRARITILSVVKWSNFTSYLLLKRNFAKVDEVTQLRQQESDLVARFLGAEHRSLDWSDAPIRFWPAEQWSADILAKFVSAPQAFVKYFPNPIDVSLLAEQLAQAVSILAPDELWIPMGLGDHIDHRTTRSACLLMLAENRKRFSHVPVSMYEDLPYAAAERHASQIGRAFVACGGKLVRATEDVSEVFEDKLRAVSIYASQFKLSYMEPMLRRFAEAESAAASGFSEAYYRLEKLSSLPEECTLSRECRGLVKLRDSAQVLMSRKDGLRRLTIMALPSSQLGGWDSVRRSLIDSFPKTEFRIYASADSAWQTKENDCRTFNVQVVRGGKSGWSRWLVVVLRELPARTPIVVLWRGAYGSEPLKAFKRLTNILLRICLPLRQVIFARALWDFSCMLGSEKSPASWETPDRGAEVA